MANRYDQPIIIKKVKKAAHAHHGGAWKIAYADFVTAMMAFFLLLWLISMTTPEQKEGLANYFAPPNVSESSSGAGGLMGGTALDEDGSQMDGASPGSYAAGCDHPGRTGNAGRHYARPATARMARRIPMRANLRPISSPMTTWLSTAPPPASSRRGRRCPTSPKSPTT